MSTYDVLTLPCKKAKFGDVLEINGFDHFIVKNTPKPKSRRRTRRIVVQTITFPQNGLRTYHMPSEEQIRIIRPVK